ncbi:MAG: metal ABC transporter ATP-binding protein [Bacilli bacterium]|nr:metal ABC transporter ATP-binding protein [Bacilli bacterium]
MKLIECSNLKIGYNNRVLNTLSFTINSGDFICIIGNNGTGKSTLIKTLLKLTPSLGGKILFDIELKKSSIGYLTQDLQVNESFPATVYEIVLSGCIGKMGAKIFYTKKEKELVNKYLEYLEIAHLKNKPFKGLSGGEQQKTLIARALCSTDKLLFLDEPLQGLDMKAALSFYEMLKKINKEENVTIILITHNVDIAMPYVNKILYLGHDESLMCSPEEYRHSNYASQYVGGHDHA